MRRYLVIVPIVLSTLTVPAFLATVGSPLQARDAASAWEYGSLELVPTGRGTAYVFCQYTSEGRTETELDLRPMTTPQYPPLSADRVRSNTDAAAARSIARLGREGWEMVVETGFARYGGDEHVLVFKRPAR